MFDPRKVAEDEIGWWKSHHERDYDRVIEQMTAVYEQLYNLTREVAQEVVMLRIEAAKEHDLAEEEGISANESQQHWDKALEFMIQHFEMLNEAIEEKDQKIFSFLKKPMESWPSPSDPNYWAKATSASMRGLKDPFEEMRKKAD